MVEVASRHVVMAPLHVIVVMMVSWWCCCAAVVSCPSCGIVGPWLLHGRVIASLSFVFSHNRSWSLLGRGDVAMAAVVCLVVVC
jgi:fucose 4-O-acetylase-like acetyltransferase